MHERKVMDDLMTRLFTVAREQRASRVTAVRVRLGVLSHMTPQHFREHFEDASRGSLAEGAQVDVQVIPDPTDPMAREIILESIEIGGTP